MQRVYASIKEKGGNLLRAAKLYESAQIYGKAYTLYENIQHFNKAIECYLKTPDPSPDALIQLYTEAGEFEKVVEIYMKSGTFRDLENALSIAKTHNFIYANIFILLVIAASNLYFWANFRCGALMILFVLFCIQK